MTTEYNIGTGVDNIVVNSRLSNGISIENYSANTPESGTYTLGLRPCSRKPIIHAYVDDPSYGSFALSDWVTNADGNYTSVKITFYDRSGNVMASKPCYVTYKTQ